MQPPKKKALIAMCILFLAMIMVTVYFSQSLEASIEYSIDISKREFNPDSINEISVNCVNRGGKDGNFYIVLSAVNASFKIKENEAFPRLYENSVWIPFSLNGGTSESKSVRFVIEESRSGFSFRVLLKELENGGIKTGVSPVSSISYRWDEAKEGYVLAAGGGAVA